MSPELFDRVEIAHRRTKNSDCYALGMVIYEVLSGRIPFYQYPNFVIPGKVVEGERPERPQDMEGVWFTDGVWEVLERCWTPQPRNRPNIEDVLQCLEVISESWTPPFPQLLAVPSIPHSLTRVFSDTTTVEITDRSVISPLSRVAPPQPSGELDPVESTGIVNGVSRACHLDEFSY